VRFLEFKLTEAKQLGRAFNHLEDLVFFYGSAGTLEALEHLKDFTTQSGSSSIRMKWDGNPQIYWGRAEKGGPLVLAGHNAWSRGVAATSPEEVEDFIVNKSGSPKTPEEQAARQEFGRKFASLYSMFDAATPTNFVGYVYADGLFLDPPREENGVYTFCPNPKSQTCYHVRADSDLGKKISQAKVMVVGHAYFPQFGMPDAQQEPMQDFRQFDNNPDVIVLGPVYNSKPVDVNTQAIDTVEAFVKQHATQIDNFLQPVQGLSDLKDIIYKYVNQTAKAKQLDSLSDNHFFQWLQASNVSRNKQTKIAEINDQNGGALAAIFELVKMIQRMKDQIIDQLEGEQGDIWDTNGEGRVRYADPDTKQFGNVKLVPRKRWTPS
jgi:hypothetical protein